MSEWLRSKKTKHAIATVLVALGGKLGLDLELDTVLVLVSGFLTAILTQGAQDVAKELRPTPRAE